MPGKSRRGWIIAGATVLALLVTAIAIGATSTKSPDKKVANSSHSTTAPTTLAPYVRPTDLPAPDVSSTPESTAPSEPATERVGGSALSITDDSGNPLADIYVTKVSVASIEPGEFGSRPEHGLFLVVYLKAVGTGASVDLNPLDFYVRGTDGGHYEDPTYSSAWGPEFSSATLHSGEHLSGTMVFDVDPKAGHGKVVYSPNLNGDPIAVWVY